MVVKEASPSVIRESGRYERSKGSVAVRNILLRSGIDLPPFARRCTEASLRLNRDSA